jgi:hypothetical protein
MSKKSTLKINKKKSSDSKIKSPSKFLGFNLYTPTIIAFIGYIILAITIVLPFEYPVYDEINDTTYIVKYDFSQRILMLLLMTIPIVLSIYSINCMMGGNCVLWSYVVSIVTIIWVAIFVVSAIVYTFHNRSVVKSESYRNF